MKFNNNTDNIFEDAARLIVNNGLASPSLVGRTFKIGYGRTSLLMDQLEGAGIVGPFEGNKHREILVKNEHDLEQLLKKIQ